MYRLCVIYIEIYDAEGDSANLFQGAACDAELIFVAPAIKNS